MNIPNLPSSVTLVAVTKTFPVETIIEAYQAGIRHFGENYVEEFAQKYANLPQEIKENAIFHMIGHVQSRKVKKVVELFDWVDSVDSVKLAKKLSEEAVRQGLSLSILIEVNLTGEATKSGFDLVGWEKDADKFNVFFQNAQAIHALRALQLRGLMIMPPLVTDPEGNREVFRSAKRLFDEITTPATPRNDNWKHLSMGTSQDYQVAIEEGATMVRLGTALFGPRT